MFKIYVYVFMCVILKCVVAQTLPKNPCPDLFKYYQNNGVVYGRMDFANDYSGYYSLSVNMSVATYLNNNQNIRIEFLTSARDAARGAPLRYNIYFPIQSVIPKPTSVVFNNRVYCSGPQEELRPGGYVSNMWASTFFRISTLSSRPRPNTDSNLDITYTTEVSFEPIPLTIPTPLYTSMPLTTTETVVVPKTQECGISSVATQQLIINGDDIQDGQFPWLVAILYRQKTNYRYRCTGTLVSERHVLTAGHCVQYYKALLFPVEDFLLVLGKRNIQNWANGAVIRDVQNIMVHPDYEQNKGDADIAILTVNKVVEVQNDIRPVCLWQEEEELDRIVGQEGIVVGWGRDESGAEFVLDAKKISLPVVSQVDCLRSDPGFASLTSSRTFCAGRRDGSGPCNGDSGAGFIMNRNGRWVLRGIVSTALGDVSVCDLDNYFVFMDTAKVKGWMNDVMQ